MELSVFLGREYGVLGIEEGLSAFAHDFLVVLHEVVSHNVQGVVCTGVHPQSSSAERRGHDLLDTCLGLRNDLIHLVLVARPIKAVRRLLRNFIHLLRHGRELDEVLSEGCGRLLLLAQPRDLFLEKFNLI